VLSTAVPAAATPHGELLKLQAELDARGALVARLEAELSAQAAAASARAAELQDSFALKVADMRRVHAQQLAELEHGYQQQVASAQAMAVAGQQEASADVQALKQQLQACNRELADTQSRLAAQQQASERLSMQLAQLQADVGQATEDKLQAARTAQYLRGEVDKLKAALSAAESRASSAEEAAAVTRAGSSQGAPAAAAAAADMNAMVSMMEGQLARLSDIIRVKESEISELRLALTLGLEERRELVGQVQALQAKVQSAGAPVAPKGEGSPWSVTSGSAAVGPGGDRSPGSRGKPALGMSQQYLGSGASAPYRTGLHSKPKFK
jgi:chromosome segregation ATPase